MKPKTKNLIKLGLLLFMAILFSGCNGKNPLAVGGFYKSNNGGLSFDKEQLAEGQVGLDGTSILAIEINPNNDKEILVGTLNSGLYKTPDEGKTWMKDVNNLTNVYGVEMIPGTNTIYVIGKKNGRGKLLKSENAGEEWRELYTEKDESSYLSSLAIHPSNYSVIYISNSEGGLFKSEDSGLTWKNLYWAGSFIRKIEIDNINPNIIYLATTQNGLLKSENRGETFHEIINSGYIYNVAAHPTQEGVIYASTKEGLMRSYDRGINWQNINTLVKPEELVSRGLAINPQNTQEIFYTSGKTFYKSTNSGETWIPVQFEMGASMEVIEINPNNPSIIYLGTNNRGGGLKITPF